MTILAIVDVQLRVEMAHDLIDVLCDLGVRVIIVSGCTTISRSVAKAAAILEKPFNGEELLAAILGLR